MGRRPEDTRRSLIITADDYGYWPSYNAGILQVVAEGAVDSVSVMTEREHCDPEPLLELGVEVGLHIEFEGRWGARSGASARSSLRVQVERFTDLFGRWPSFLDGHKHCHSRPEMATPVLELAQQIGAPVRSVSADHRQWLSERGIDTPDRVVGRLQEDEQAEPDVVRAVPIGVTEWFVHPGIPDPESGSSYDAGRREDIDLLMRLQLRSRYDEPVWGDAIRSTHAEAFGDPEEPVEDDEAAGEGPPAPG